MRTLYSRREADDPTVRRQYGQALIELGLFREALAPALLAQAIEVHDDLLERLPFGSWELEVGS